jgi:hypothetical protein
MRNKIGFLTIAQNNDKVDYLTLAYVQAMNVKILHPGYEYAVIVDKNTAKSVTDKMKKVFDYIIELPIDLAERHSTKYANEVQVIKLSPFRETFKLESDLLFTRPITHWIHALRKKNIVLANNCKNYRNINVDSMRYRNFFKINNLPNIYTGLMYFRYCKEAFQFFQLAEKIQYNWKLISDEFIKVDEDTPSTDVLYAITAKLYGIEECTIPSLDFFNFIHLKLAINEWGWNNSGWTDIVSHEFDDNMIRINNLNQYYPVHYFEKSFCSQEIIEYFEDKYEQLG